MAAFKGDAVKFFCLLSIQETLSGRNLSILASGLPLDWLEQMNGTRESAGRVSATTSKKLPGTSRRLLLGVFLIGLGILVARIFASFSLPITEATLEGIVLLLAFASTIASLSGQLPVQNVLLATVIIAIVGGGIQLLGALTGIPFGPIVYAQDAGPQLFNSMSWAVPFIWVIAVLNSRGVARLIMRPWRKLRVYGYWLIGLTALLTLLFDFGLEPYATYVKHYWLWRSTKLPIDWYGTPLSNFLGWLVTTLLILAFTTPSLMRKKPAKAGRNYDPLVVWVSLNILFSAGSFSQHLLLAAAVSAVACIAVIVFAVRGARW